MPMLIIWQSQFALIHDQALINFHIHLFFVTVKCKIENEKANTSFSSVCLFVCFLHRMTCYECRKDTHQRKDQNCINKKKILAQHIIIYKNLLLLDVILIFLHFFLILSSTFIFSAFPSWAPLIISVVTLILGFVPSTRPNIIVC